MARTTRQMTRETGRTNREAGHEVGRRSSGGNGQVHEHRTAKVVELIGASKKGFDEAIRNALKDAMETTRGITGAHIANMSVKCDGDRITEYKVDLKVAFGIERTRGP